MKAAKFIEMESNARNWGYFRNSVSRYLFYLFHDQIVDRVYRCVDIQICTQTWIQTREETNEDSQAGSESERE